MDTANLQNIIKEKVLKSEDKNLPDQTDKLTDSQFIISSKPGRSFDLDSTIEQLPNEVLFYQHISWISEEDINHDAPVFPFSEKLTNSESLNHSSAEIVSNEILFYQNMNWLVD